MAISRLAISNPGATTDTLLHTATRSSLASIIATNKANTVAEVRVWIIPQGQDATPANWSYIAYDADITATNSLETFRFPVMSGDKIYVRSTTADVSFQIMGIYETGADTYVYAQPNEPTAPQVGDIWVDTASDVPSIDNTTVYRWSKTAVGGETSLSGTGNDLSILKYIAGYEQVYLNGVLLAKDLDYFATNGTSITSLTALSAGDIVEVISPYAIELTDVYTKSVSDSKYSTLARQGMFNVVPNSVTGGTISANGEITIGSGVTSIAVNGCFSSIYDNYKILFFLDNHNGGASVEFSLQGIASGYFTTGYYMSFGVSTVTGYSSASIDRWYCTFNNQATYSSAFQMDLMSPNLAKRKVCAVTGQGANGPSQISGTVNSTIQSTGFTITKGSDTMTGGKIRIYGYNNGGA
jgi:hypothetical protein